jgi:hypothetical protein
LVVNDVAFSSCASSNYRADAVPPSHKEFGGPVQGLVPIVPSSYTYYNDSTVAELQDIFVCMGNGRILTFTNNSTIYSYDPIASGIPELWSRGIGLANAGVLTLSLNKTLVAGQSVTAENMVTVAVGASIAPDQTIGYTSTEFYDEHRNLVRALKVRGVGQKLAYWPDSDMTSTDKVNIRDGRYTIQSPLRLVAAVDAGGVPTNPGARKLIDWFQGNAVTDPALQLPFDVNEVFAKKGVVPQCAMRVTKDSDLPRFRRYRHPQPCHCSFEMLATGKKSIPGCIACADSSTCAAGKVCSHGYCE